MAQQWVNNDTRDKITALVEQHGWARAKAVGFAVKFALRNGRAFRKFAIAQRQRGDKGPATKAPKKSRPTSKRRRRERKKCPNRT